MLESGVLNEEDKKTAETWFNELNELTKKSDE
jgi:hypothetical protein